MAMVGKQAMVLVASAFLSVALTGCASYKPAPKVFHEATIQPYRLDSGDRLRITVFEQASLTNTYTVDQAGYIAFPLVGQVAARGATLTQLEGAIALKLKQGFLRDPDVSIEVDRYRSIFVMGQVGQPVRRSGPARSRSGTPPSWPTTRRCCPPSWCCERRGCPGP